MNNIPAQTAPFIADLPELADEEVPPEFLEELERTLAAQATALQVLQQVQKFQQQIQQQNAQFQQQIQQQNAQFQQQNAQLQQDMAQLEQRTTALEQITQSTCTVVGG